MTAQEIVAQIKDLPPISEAALKLVTLLERAEANNDDVVQVLRQDAVLTAKLLRACNSPAFALEASVTSVDQAVLILGYTHVFQMTVAIAFSGTMVTRLPGYQIEANELWHHSVHAASAAETAVRVGIGMEVDPAIAFTVGLLHDIGKVALSRFLSPEAQLAVRNQVARGQPVVEAEREVLGTDHAEVGACLLRNWHLPCEIAEATANHHSPELQPTPRLSAVAHLADCLAHLTSGAPGWDAHALRGSDSVLRALSVNPTDLEHLMIAVAANHERSEHLMEVP
jgi:putative nucleotidyltransferase with HDIG domain